jgi:ABC-type nitrate/sulfonate/bicarbonate transport system permease component
MRGMGQAVTAMRRRAGDRAAAGPATRHDRRSVTVIARTWIAARARTLIPRLLGIAALIGGWAYASTQLAPVEMPSPAATWTALRENLSSASYLRVLAVPGGYLSNVAYTLDHALLAWLVGGSIGMALGLASSRLQLLRDTVGPLFILFGAVPPLVAGPFLLTWFGVGMFSQEALVALVAFVILGISAQNAALSIDPAYEEVAATLGVGARRRFLTIVLPASLPAIVGAARIALATSWSIQVVAELYGSRAGVGRVISASDNLSYTAGTLAIVLLLAVCGGVIDQCVGSGLRLLTRWQDRIAI